MSFKCFLLLLICFFSFQIIAGDIDSIHKVECTFKLPPTYLLRHGDDISIINHHVEYFFSAFSECNVLSKSTIEQAKISSILLENIGKQLRPVFKDVILRHAKKNPEFPYELLNSIVNRVTEKYINLYVWNSLSE